MHVVFVCREYPPSRRMGGIASYIKETAEDFVQKGHQISVICASDDTRKETKDCVNGVRVIRLSKGDFIIEGEEPGCAGLKKFRTIYRFYSYRKKIRETVFALHAENPIDIIEVPEYGAEGYYLADINIPLVVRLHTPSLLDRKTQKLKSFKLRSFYAYWTGKKELAVVKKVRHITSCSDCLRDWFFQFVPQITSDIKTIYNPINMTNWIVSPSEYDELGILYAGTVAEEKGVGDLIEACNLLHKRGVEVQLTIAGKLGAYARKLKTLCEGAGYTWCEFVGHISREELKTLYAKSKISCFPSWWENLPLVCLEAMAVGNVVIGSSNGGMAEIIDDGVEGFLVEPQNPSLLADKIETVLSLSKEDVFVLKGKAQARIYKQFSSDVIVGQLEEYYLSVINEY